MSQGTVEYYGLGNSGAIGCKKWLGSLV